jgi:hypothetical protein
VIVSILEGRPVTGFEPAAQSRSGAEKSPAASSEHSTRVNLDLVATMVSVLTISCVIWMLGWRTPAV